MYTVCWTIFTPGKSTDRWERCDSRREVAALLIREGLVDDGEVLIFGPEAEDSLLSAEDIFAGI